MTAMKNKIGMTASERIYQVVIVSVVAVVCLVCLFPFLYVIGMSLTSQGEMIERNFFVIIPRHPTFRAYELIFQYGNILQAFMISVARTVMGALAALVLTVPGGYILSRQDLPGRGAFTVFFLITMILSGGLIPGYLLIKSLHLMDTFWVYIVPAMGSVFNMLIIKIMVEDMPRELMESADIDGATELQKLIRIALPLLVPTLCALGLFAAVAQWNSWFDAMLYVQNQNLYPLSYIVKQMMTSINMSDTVGNIQNAWQRATPESGKMASVVFATIPILCVYPFLQKYFIYGVFTGSVKG